MHYSKLIQSSPTSTTFERNSPNKYRNPTITSITVLFRQNTIFSCSTTWILRLMWSRIPMTRSERYLLVTTRSAKPLPYSIPRLILHSPYLPRIRVTDVSGFNPLTLHPFHQCSRHPRDPRFGMTNGHSTRFVQSIIRAWYHSKSPRDLYVFIVGPLLRSEDTHDQPERQHAHHNDHWQSHDPLQSIGGGHLHSDDNPIRSTHVCVQGLERFQTSNLSL